MTVSLAAELALADQLADSGGLVHTLVPSENYRADDRVLVTRDGLRVYLHRALYRRLVGDLSDSEFLIRTCDYTRCVNPWHFRKTATPRKRLARCRNNHTYTDEDSLPGGGRRCHVCAEGRAARRPRKGTMPYWAVEARRKFCPYQHPYTPENTYRYGNHRKCKTCTLARARGKDPAEIYEWPMSVASD